MVSEKQFKIGIIGGIRAGKDTVAQILYKEFYRLNEYKHTHITAFSKGIHDVISLLLPDAYSEGKPRKELQHIGQSMRQLDEDVWVNYLLNSSLYSYLDFAEDNIVITDVRQKNEAERLKAEGFILLKVTASKEARLERAKLSGDNFNPDHFNHETEVSMEELPFDYMINNNGTVDELTLQIRSVIDSIREEVSTNEL